MLTKLLGIGSNTFRETIRQPVYGLLLAFTIAVLIFNPMLALYTLDDDNKFMQEIGLSTLLVGGLLFAAFGASRGLSVEVENKTALTVLSKPVSRTTFILGKYLGLAAAVTLAMYVVGLVFLFTVRHKVMQSASQPYDQPVWMFGALAALFSLLVAALWNYLSGAHFPTAALAVGTPVLTIGLLLTGIWDAKWNLNDPYGKGIDVAMLAAMLLVWQAVLLLAAIALAAGTRLKQAATLAVTFGALLLGLWNDSFFGVRSGLASGIVPTTSQPATAPWSLSTSAPATFVQLPHDPAWLKTTYAVCYRALPNFNFYWVSDAILQNVPIPFTYVVQVGLYTACYVAAMLALGVMLFQTREVS